MKGGHAGRGLGCLAPWVGRPHSCWSVQVALFRASGQRLIRSGAADGCCSSLVARRSSLAARRSPLLAPRHRFRSGLRDRSWTFTGRAMKDRNVFDSASATAVATDSPPPALASQDRSFFGHPRGLSTLFFTEMWERFSYYGIRPLLVLFMAAALRTAVSASTAARRRRSSASTRRSVYLASLPGGWIADRLLGLRRAILYGAVLISVGHISIGLSAFAGEQGAVLPRPDPDRAAAPACSSRTSRRSSATCIRKAARAATPASRSSTWASTSARSLGQLVTGLLGEKVGWHYGFGAAGVGMLIGLIAFAAARAARRSATIGMRADAACRSRRAGEAGARCEAGDRRRARGHRRRSWSCCRDWA